jgi:glycosyltransferase involved in cell wall biosynthesis
MRRKADEAGLSGRITWHGDLSDAALAAEMRAAHVLVVPSSYEGFGIVYLEGMGFGLPALGTTAGAAGEIIRDGENGYLIAPDDAATLAGRLETLAADRALLGRLGAAALDSYGRFPTWAETVATIRAFLLDLVERRRG